MFPGTKALPMSSTDNLCRNLWAYCLDNARSSTSHNSITLQRLSTWMKLIQDKHIRVCTNIYIYIYIQSRDGVTIGAFRLVIEFTELFYFSFSDWGESTWFVSYYLASCTSLAWWVTTLWSSRWNEWRGKPKDSEKTCLSATLSTTNPTWPDTGSNPDHLCRKPEPELRHSHYWTHADRKETAVTESV
jgi:hypothetical protein